MAKAYTVFMDEELNKKYHFFLDNPVSKLCVLSHGPTGNAYFFSLGFFVGQHFLN